MLGDARLIDLPLGLPGSGRQRYGAAMALHRDGVISDAVLEVYRVASAHDHDDPRKVLADRGLEAPRRRSPDPVRDILDLVYEADRYLARLSGPGLAENRACLARWRNGPVTALPQPRPNKVVETWLEPALTLLEADEPALAFSIRAASPYMDWVTYDLYSEAEIGPVFGHSHAYCSIFGAEAAIAASGFDFGLFLIEPHVFYRDHCHIAPEIYLPLTGPNGWRFAPDAPLTVLPAHRPVWNEPMAIHATKVGPQPFLAFFGWTADVDAAAVVVPASDWAAMEALRLG